MNKENGFIALTTSIILSILVLLVAASLGSANLFNRFAVVDFSNKQASFSVARSCLNYSLLKLAEGSSYAGNETLTVASYTCAIGAITTSGANKVITAKSQINGATTNLRLTVVTASLSTVSLEELQ